MLISYDFFRAMESPELQLEVLGAGALCELDKVRHGTLTKTTWFLLLQQLVCLDTGPTPFNG